MKIGLIGPNNVYRADAAERKVLLVRTAEIIAKSNNEVVLTPDSNSLLEYFADQYHHFGGKKVWLVIPTQQPDHDHYLNTELGEVISCDNWDGQADEFNRQCDVFVCAGYAWGAMKEIACAQYFNKKKVFMLEECISEKLPEELNFLVDYISVNDLAASLNSLTT
jgi:hypothetical protein